MGFKYILFDLDGTLTDSKEGIIKCVQYALKEIGIDEPDLNKLLPFIGPPLVWSFMNYYGLSENEAKKAVEKYRVRFSKVGLFENGVYEGIHNMLEKLTENGKVLAVATSKPYFFAEKILKKYDLEKYFDVVIGSELDGTRGKKSEVIEDALIKLSIDENKKKDVVMVGDREHDIIGAKDNGIKSVGVLFGYSAQDELSDAGADYIVSSVCELLRFLRG